MYPRYDPTGLSVISAPKTMLSVSYYDAEERVIATATASHRGDITSTATSYTRGGLPSSVTTTLSPSSAGDEASHIISTTAVYDSQGRVLSTRLSRNDAPPVTLASHTYDSRGHLQRTTLVGGMQRSHDYDLHGWLTKWQCPFVGQQLLYADGATPSFTGRISSKLTATAGHTDRYDYRYDPLGRLTAAAFSRLMPDGTATTRADFSTAYTYDLQGNILSLTRHGLIAPGVYGLVDDITATFSGNQLSALRDDAPSVLLESSLDLPEGSWAGTDFDYDPNGNLTRDMSRGVAEVQYNVLNLPQHIDFETGGWIDYHYSGSGTKLAETVYDADGSLIARRDYVGIFEFESDTLRRTLLPEGFITEADGIFHAFIPDHQGNIVGIYNSAADSLEQYTDYYPYGLPHATATAPQLNRRKYGAKELTTDLGLNLYDFAARWHNPAFPRFTTPDPLTETYTPISPYTYCASDPINHTDPTGMIIDMNVLLSVEQELGFNIVDRVILDLKEFTGLNIFIDDLGQLDYEKDSNNNPIVSIVEIEGEQIRCGSKTAQEILIEKIASSSVINISYNPNKSAHSNNDIALSPNQINTFLENAIGVDGRTLGYGMTFLHELIHTNGHEYEDVKGRIGTGKTVDTMNKIRQELNEQKYNFGKRMNYEALPINSGKSIIPFDSRSFRQSMDGLHPTKNTKYIIVP